MGNKFREKVAEEGLDGRVAEEEVVRAGKSAEDAEVAPEVENEEAGDDAPRGRGKRVDKVAKGVSKVLGGDILGDRLVVRQIPLMLLCLLFLLLIVANRYKVESLSREKEATEERINDLREHRIQMQKQYQKSVKISQIAEELSEEGVGITSGPPYEL